MNTRAELRPRFSPLTRGIVTFSDMSILFCVLNPSKPDEERSDSPVTKYRRYTSGWALVANLSPLRSADAKVMLTAGDEPEEVSEINLHVIRETAAIVVTVVVGWGMDGAAEGRAERTKVDRSSPEALLPGHSPGR